MSDNQLTAPIPCRTCGGNNDCQIEAQYPNGDGRGYFVDCPDCDGTGFDTSCEACPYCEQSLSLDVHGQCIEQFRSAITSGRTLETIAKAALDAAGYDSLDDPWCTDDYCEGPVEWDTATDRWRQNGYRIADAVLGAIEASGRVTVDRAPATLTFEEAQTLREWFDDPSELTEKLKQHGLMIVRISGLDPLP